MELKPNMYVRYKNGIGKIVAKYVKGVLLDKGKGGYFRTESVDILKASHNIIDLIEVGDYVNRKLVEDIFEKTNYADKSIKLKGSGDYWYNEHIKTIVTKEQFSSMEYKVGE